MSSATKVVYCLFIAATIAAMVAGVAGPGLIFFVIVVGFAFHKDWQARNIPTATIIQP